MTDKIYVLAKPEQIARVKDRILEQREYNIFVDIIIIEFLLNEEGFTVDNKKAGYPKNGISS